MNKNFIKHLLVSGVSLFFVLAVLGCGGDKADMTSFQRPPAPVLITDAVKRDVPEYLDAVGKTVAREVVSIQPQVSGRVTKIHFQDGAYLKRGAPLFTIDPREYQAAVHAAEATVDQRQAAVDLARIEFERVENLVDKKAISKQDYDARRNAVQVAEAQLKQSRSQLEMAQLNLSYTLIRSPIDGRAGHRLVDIGNIVTPDTESLLTVQRLHPIYTDFTITENQLSAVQKNMKRGTLLVEVRLPDQEDAARQGEVTFLDNAVQEGTGTVKVRATIPNEDQFFWPGRFVNVRLVLDTRQNAVLIPADAPQMSAKGPFVYIVNEDLIAELRPVTLGQRQGDLIVVTDGLQPGERVVTKGQLGVTPGGKVRIEESLASRNSGGISKGAGS